MKKAILYGMITIILWGTQPPITKLLLSNLPNFETLGISCLFAFLFLLLFNMKAGNGKEIYQLKIKDYGRLMILGLLGIFMYSALYYYGLSELKAQEASVLNYLWPIFFLIFSSVCLKEKFTWIKGMSVFISFLGGVLLITKGRLSFAEIESTKGVISCIFAAACYGLFCVLNKKEKEKQSICMMIYFGITAIVSLGISFVYEKTVTIGLPQLAGLLWLGIAIDAIAFLSWAIALQLDTNAQISNLAYFTPFLSMIFSFFFLKEKIEWISLLGFGIILMGIFLPQAAGKIQKISSKF